MVGGPEAHLIADPTNRGGGVRKRALVSWSAGD
jgi:hypothetical protein